jgi:hypothetical protein
MPKLACPCGFVHDLSSIPDDGWRVIRDKEFDSYFEQLHIFADGFNAQLEAPAREASDRAFQHGPTVGLLYDCPKCGRIIWRQRPDSEWKIYGLEKPVA